MGEQAAARSFLSTDKVFCLFPYRLVYSSSEDGSKAGLSETQEKLSGRHQRACPFKEGQGQWFDSIVGHSAERLKTLYLENCIRVKSLINRESLN